MGWVVSLDRSVGATSKMKPMGQLDNTLYSHPLHFDDAVELTAAAEVSILEPGEGARRQGKRVVSTIQKRY
jgi:hypothetical protein